MTSVESDEDEDMYDWRSEEEGGWSDSLTEEEEEEEEEEGGGGGVPIFVLMCIISLYGLFRILTIYYSQY